MKTKPDFPRWSDGAHNTDCKPDLFALAIFLGFELITKVPPTLHTPLMSGANAISGISIVGAIIGANVLYEAGQTQISGVIAFLLSY